MTSTFQGMYVEDVKRALTASALSGVHCLLIGAPGLGKTTIAKAMAKKMFPGKSVFLRFDSTTPPERIQGYPDIAKLLSDPPEYVLVREGSAYDPSAKVLIADEIGRAMDTTFDIMLDVLDRQDINLIDAPVIWATANFMPTSDRTEAFRERLGMWPWLPNERLDTKAVVSAQLSALGTGLEITDHLPTFEDIMRVRAMTPGPNAIKACAELIETLANEAEMGSVTNDQASRPAAQSTVVFAQTVNRFSVNPRRIDQWGRILYRMGAWITGDPDFKEVPNEARLCLQWAYPLTDEKMAQQWKTICMAVADPIEAAIDQLKANAFRKFDEVKNSGLDRRKASLAFGEVLSDSIRELEMLGDDERITTAIEEVNIAFANYAAGRDPFKASEDNPF